MSLDDAERLGLLNCCSVSTFATNCNPGWIADTLSLDFAVCEMGPVPHSGLPRLSEIPQRCVLWSLYMNIRFSPRPP